MSYKECLYILHTTICILIRISALLRIQRGLAFIPFHKAKLRNFTVLFVNIYENIYTFSIVTY